MIRVVTRLNKGIYRSDREAWEKRDIELPATRAHLAYALDVADYRSIETTGSYGTIGAGSTNVEIDTPDGVLTVDDYPDRADLPEMEDGNIDEFAGNILAMQGSVWDGNNHVPFTPSRSLAWLSDDKRRVEDSHCIVQWPGSDEYAPEVEAVPGWAIVDESWTVWGNEGWRCGADTVDDITNTLDAAEIEHDEFYMDYGQDGADVVVVVPEDKLTTAQAALDAAF